jgi:hypothetical protein
MLYLWQVDHYKRRYAEWSLSCLDDLWQLGIRTEIVKSNVVAVICLHGEQFKFCLHLDAKYGKGTAEELLQQV